MVKMVKISRLPQVVNALEEITRQNKDPELLGTRSQLLNPDNIMFLLLLADVLAHVNRFSKFLQKKNLVYSNVNKKSKQLTEALHSLHDKDRPLFSTHAEEFLSLSQERMGLARRVRRSALLEEGFDLAEKITSFNAEIKKPFIRDLLQEIDKAMKMNDNVLLAFDVFNAKTNLSAAEKRK